MHKGQEKLSVMQRRIAIPYNLAMREGYQRHAIATLTLWWQSVLENPMAAGQKLHRPHSLFIDKLVGEFLPSDRRFIA